MKKKIFLQILTFALFSISGYQKTNAGTIDTDSPPLKNAGVITYIDVGISQPNVEDCYGVSVIPPDFSFDAGNIKIYPNPGKGIFTFELSLPFIANQVEISVHDIAGKQVFQEIANVRAESIVKLMDLGFLGRGIYFVRVVIQPGHLIKTQRLIIF